MGAIVPEPVEQYLAGLNRVPDPVLQDIAREGRDANLPLIDAEVGRGVDVVVNLAAGLDTRPYRMDLPASLLWIEVDLPPLIAYWDGRRRAGGWMIGMEDGDGSRRGFP